jgi:hypothetical protein
MKINSKFVLRALALMLAILILLPAAVSCTARPLAQTKLAGTEVGKVGDYSVAYEEFYFLAHNYYEAVKNDYKDDKAALKNAVWEYVEENITSNYAILTLCEQEGIPFDEKELKKEVKKQIELVIESSFDGKRTEYLRSQRAAGLTDHYVRFVTGVDILYSRLETKYLENGTVPNTEYSLKNYIMKNFAHTWHIAVFVNEGETREENLAKIEEAQKLLDDGTYSMYNLIGSKYNEDVTPDYLSDAYGYYFPRGIMDEKYEDAAFSMAVGDNAIVETRAQNSKGEYVDCFYLIEKLSTTSEASKVEIENNLGTLTDYVGDAIINDKKEAIQATLSFEPNDFAKSLDVSNLEPVKNGADYQLIIAIVCTVVAVAAVAVAIILIRRARTRRFQSLIKKK